MFRLGDLNGFHAADFWSSDLPHRIRQVRSDEALPLRWVDIGQNLVQNVGCAGEFTKKMVACKGLGAPQTGADGGVQRGGTNETCVREAYSAVDINGYWLSQP